MRMWLQAIALLTATKKGISLNELHRMIGYHPQVGGVHAHQIREAMRTGELCPAHGRQ